jgi:hypothetical protein
MTWFLRGIFILFVLTAVGVQARGIFRAPARATDVQQQQPVTRR